MHERMLSRVVTVALLTAGTLLTMAAFAGAKVPPEQQCQKSRYEAAAKYAQCQSKALGQHFAVNDLAKLQPILSKCRVKYTSTYLKLQKKALGTGSTCDAPRFVDNDDGTVTDNLTGLDWEQKVDTASIHVKSATYTWFNTYNSFLAGVSSFGINEEQPPDFIACFGGRCDWRLPTVAELQTILSEPFPCTTSPCINAAFGPTATNEDYWSATTLADNTTYAWGVFFGTGEVSYGLKNGINAVRAVRGGL